MPTLGQIRAAWRDQARDRRTNPRDIDVLLSDALGKPIAYVIAHDDQEIGEAALEAFKTSANERFSGKPLQYIRGRCEFYGRDFKVDTRVLIPRPETELLVELAIERAPQGSRVVDIGTGSGCIAVSIAAERPDLHVFATDISVEALVVAGENSRSHGVHLRTAAVDALNAIRGMFDVIVGNPPYVPSDTRASLQVEVRDHEPEVALFSDDHGLRILDRIIGTAADHLLPTGTLILELGFGQAARVRDVATRHGWPNVAFVNDLAAIPRAVVLSRG